MRRITLLLLAGTVALQMAVAQAPTPEQNQRYFDINKNIDIFNSIIRELDLFYVDSIEVNQLIQGTINNMLTRLDPYTEYYPEENVGELQFMTTGEYAASVPSSPTTRPRGNQRAVRGATSRQGGVEGG